MAPQPSMDLPSPFADPLSSFLLSHSTATADPGEPEPALRVTIKGPLLEGNGHPPREALELKVLLQPLQLHYQPSCFARLSRILASPTGKSRTAELMDVISAHDSLEVQSLTVAELACSSKQLPAVSVEVRTQHNLPIGCSSRNLDSWTSNLCWLQSHPDAALIMPKPNQGYRSAE